MKILLRISHNHLIIKPFENFGDFWVCVKFYWKPTIIFEVQEDLVRWDFSESRKHVKKERKENQNKK